MGFNIGAEINSKAQTKIRTWGNLFGFERDGMKKLTVPASVSGEIIRHIPVDPGKLRPFL
jgi:hypothetical protein